MTKIEKLEREITTLSGVELSEFRRWFLEFDASAWDRQVEADVNAGALDSLADEALPYTYTQGKRLGAPE